MSPTDSPRENCISSPRRTIGVAPSSATPTSKEIRVRVEGRWKIERDAAPGQRIGAEPLAAAGFQLQRPVEQLAELEGAELFAGEEVALQAADTTDRGAHGDRLEPLPRAGFPARPASCAAGARGCCGSTSATRPTSRSTATSPPSSRRCSPAGAWDVALLQECPPRFAEPLARACGAEAHRALTSRNALGPLRALLARQNPDLMASGEGGSNLTLVRVPGRLGGIAERRELAIHEGEPERRSMALTRTASRPLRRQPARDQRPPGAGGRGRAARRPRRERVRRRARR